VRAAGSRETDASPFRIASATDLKLEYVREAPEVAMLFTFADQAV